MTIDAFHFPATGDGAGWGGAVYPSAQPGLGTRRIVRLCTPPPAAPKKPKRAPRAKAGFKGYVQVSILFHLRQVGSASAHRLSALMGTSRAYILSMLARMVVAGLVLIQQPHKATLFSLTKQGAAQAATVDRKDVEFA